MKNNLNRRKFVGKSLMATAGLITLPTILPAKVFAGPGRVLPNEKINLAHIGVGGMGSGHVRTFVGQDDVRTVAICDVRKENRDKAKATVDTRYGNKDCATYNDFREVLARKDIDAIVMAAPDHWHVLIGIEAARQGKAMYYEKPMSYTFEQAKAIREAINRYNVVFQFGTQQRSDQRFRFVTELVRNGKIGSLKRIVAGSASYSAVPVQPIEKVPEGLDYELWLGPAPWSPYTNLRCTRNWMLIRDYSLGCIGGAWGIHHVDIAQWAVNADNSGPVEVEGKGKIPADGLYDTIQFWEAEHTYANGVKLLHIDHGSAVERFPQFKAAGGANTMGILFEGTEGWIYVARGFMDANPKSLLKTVIGPNEIRLPVSNDHARNFLDAVRSGSEPICPVGPGVRSEMVCQQADIAIRTGQKLRWDPVKEEFIDNPVANRMLASPMRSPWHF
jgi:predicted dehydrogenase